MKKSSLPGKPRHFWNNKREGPDESRGLVFCVSAVQLEQLHRVFIGNLIVDFLGNDTVGEQLLKESHMRVFYMLIAQVCAEIATVLKFYSACAPGGIALYLHLFFIDAEGLFQQQVIVFFQNRNRGGHFRYQFSSFAQPKVSHSLSRGKSLLA